MGSPRRMSTDAKTPPDVGRPDAKTSPEARMPREVRIGFLVHDVSRMRRTLFDQAMKPLGITRSQWWVLSQLSRRTREGMLQTELARDLDVGKVTVGGLIDRLEAAGYVERRPDRVDRRAKRVVVTERGRAILDQMVAVGHGLNEIILAGLGPDAVAETERSLEVMKDNIRRRIVEREEGDAPADLPVGLSAPEEAADQAPMAVPSEAPAAAAPRRRTARA